MLWVIYVAYFVRAPVVSKVFELIRNKEKSLMEEPVVVEIAKKYKKLPAQILLRHAIQRGVVVLVKSVSEERVKSNFEVVSI